MKRIHYYLLGIFILVFVVTLSSWLGAHHSAKSLQSETKIVEEKVHESVLSRYITIEEIINEVNTTDELLQSKINDLKSAYTLYKNKTQTKEELYSLEHTFGKLTVYLKDHKDKYTPFTLSEETVAKFESSTTEVVENIQTLNSAINKYNTTLKVFPNIIYLSKYERFEMWDLSTFVQTLPDFS
ncbi:MAG: hypothetical protein WC275_03285 [Bacilli bacterium]